MQDEVENRVLTLIVSSGKFTGRTFVKAVNAYWRHHGQKRAQRVQVKQRRRLTRQQARDSPVGQQTLKSLLSRGKALDSIEVQSPEIREFEKLARKYNVEYAVKKERSTGRFFIFFKSQDTGSLNTVFREYTAVMQQKQGRVQEKRSQKSAHKTARRQKRVPLAKRLASAKMLLAQTGRTVTRHRQPPSR